MKKIDGKIGLVLFVDTLIQKEVNKLSLRYQNNRIVFGGKGGCHPHITLFQTKVKKLPLSFIKDLLIEISSKIPISISMNRIYFFGGHFIFWETENNKELVLLHKKALELADYFDAEGEQQADSESVTLTHEENANVRKYGYPFVDKLWRPHITIAYVENPKINNIHKNKMKTLIKSIGFAEIGKYGTIKKIIKKIDV